MQLIVHTFKMQTTKPRIQNIMNTFVFNRFFLVALLFNLSPLPTTARIPLFKSLHRFCTQPSVEVSRYTWWTQTSFQLWSIISVFFSIDFAATIPCKLQNLFCSHFQQHSKKFLLMWMGLAPPAVRWPPVTS
jgi:hypothetical protein